MKTKRILLIALFISLAAILSIVERSIIIPQAHPGVKLGLANVITLLSIIMLGYKDAFLVVLLRCVLATLIGGNPVSFLFSITGGLFSTLVMVLLWRTFNQHISIVNISIIGAICHNLGQLFVASWLAHELLLYSLLPILMISAVITGYAVGVVTKRVYKSLQARQVKVYS
ncbi:Gx transporter family protein [Desulforamulus aeronauticus]|uniref:Heptaprenyl diphosphate synthase n=1 Tax=Desulforamulus aeronauticus DSM 10349 TaxID=1121421 RepID=A0A1M6UIL7_9FIRM|nr:Gx transporter family protein [Desulforamulus aeronauticus]SHK68993.1 heptaprenyl diphosphate synthase [Desulforamulus aeronauticus DSM 10349]